MPGFGQNGSVAWVVNGKRGNGHVHEKHKDGQRGRIDDPPVKNFLVRLRFPNPAARDAAWANRDQVTLPNGEVLVTLRVPAQPVNAARKPDDLDGNDEPNVNPPWEVGIDWELA